MKLPIPVNIITGSLGVGKTTVVQHILSQKPPDEKWALLVNEFGALGIDAALVEASLGSNQAPAGAPPDATGAPAGAGVVVRELAGGCLCCALSGPLGVAVAQLVRRARPDRLIIEPSGLGHPAGLLDTLHSEHLRSALDVRAVICLVDVRQVAEADLGAAAGSTTTTTLPALDTTMSGTVPEAAPRPAGRSPGPPAPPAPATAVPLTLSETFQDQVNVADVLVGHKADLASEGQCAAFWRWAAEQYPPKAQVLLASHGRIDPALLDLPRAPVFRPVFKPLAHSSSSRQRRTALQRPAVARGPLPAEQQQQPLPASLTAAVATTTVAGDSGAGAGAEGGLVAAGPSSGAEAARTEGVETAPCLAEGGDDGPEEQEEADGVDKAPVLVPRQPLRFPSASPQTPDGTLPAQPAQLRPTCHEAGAEADQAAAEADAADAAVERGASHQGGAAADPALAEEVSCGWMFSPEDLFDRGRLAKLLGAVWPAAVRLKGIFRVGKSSYVVPYLQPNGEVVLRPVSYRRESRLEVIVRRRPGQGQGQEQEQEQGRPPPQPVQPLQPPQDGGERDQERQEQEEQEEQGGRAGSGRSGAGGGAGWYGAEGQAQERVLKAVEAADWDVLEAALIGALQ